MENNIELKSIIEVKNYWAVCNGFFNWEEFIEPFRKNGNDIPEAIVDELLEIAVK
jgi:hypothetical protein